MTEKRQSLTHLERVSLQSIARGESIDSIAEHHGESPAEIEALLASARRKLTASTNLEAIARAVKFGLIE